MNALSKLLLGTALGLSLSACATGGNDAGEMEIRSGKIEQITPAQITSTHHTGLGAIVGGLGGLALGSLIGNGTGRDVAMAAGAIGGAFAGNAVQDNYDKPKPGEQVIVRLRSGVLVSITQPITNTLTPGEAVYVEGSGTDARVVPQF
ncbi:glycine zipper 2TM domain-containing protein [Pseudomonas sp. N040]|uniref:glycine zipper 2TM domain-containing protein n=1 Tax=Pseudomonas sp. N040 TaxID=2785325 RepID=UPI0018A295AE|nr:glycine zipper 2TM domain-containing protein [Pseudomonas sp. N040]MBF7728567.1 glycine zipper 2TM domain-containing protein [Pseudomonas sp. N040]MBW7012207.1 glycine zipper 2TM domain-containing protein [Pseudomonas sp. N040]